MPEQSRQQALNAAANAAVQRLKEAHTDEFNTLYAEEAKKRGQEWSPRLTPEQRAARDLQVLLATYPHLAEGLQPKSAPSEGYSD